MLITPTWVGVNKCGRSKARAPKEVRANIIPNILRFRLQFKLSKLISQTVLPVGNVSMTILDHHMHDENTSQSVTGRYPSMIMRRESFE